MLTLEFTIDITPKPKARPRFTRRGFAYTPKETVEYEREIRNCAAEYMELRGLEPLETPVAVYLHFSMPTPKSLSKNAPKMHTKRPDVDNLAKSVLDGLSPCWKDDSQVWSLSMKKTYATVPCVSIRIVATVE